MPAPTTPAQALATRLLADSGVSALVAARVWPTKPSDLKGGYPYVVFYKTDGGDGMRLDGPNKLQRYGMRVDIYGQDEGSTEPIRLAVLAAVKGWQDLANNVQGCFPQGDADQVLNDDGTETCGQSLSLWFMG